jgi:hypothetical protein
MLFRLAGSSSLLIIGLGMLAGCGSAEQLGSTEVSGATAPGAALSESSTNCNQRNPGVTGIEVQVRIDKYQGLITGRNGTHEIAYGTVTSTPWVYDSAIVDTSNVQLALNVKSSTDPSGLPHEIPFTVGESVTVKGEYIPASTANAHDAAGPAAVIHFAHSPCGFVEVGTTIYQ